MISERQAEKQAAEWSELYHSIQKVLRRNGTEHFAGRGDYWLVEDNWGPESYSQRVLVFSFKMIRPDIVRSLQRLLTRYPNWEIYLGLAPNERPDDFPEMGITIRKNEIVDGLRREYLPPEFRDLQYEDARVGTAKD